ncbi:histidine kinase dimerization/phosphoacceptor domain -containing protein [Chloroflexus sp.]|uniref:histidine kinase dimerization/phosphoacceptor domain -containing protein n=1 Tax=Chloroflexus sp. TaxID=1904827 RepID=UPI00298F143B|nr:histidine kinase dimerization/phosphoacceptor domain -containing protein [Chloroflexus sp.]MDW8405797.1 histidine kinase dimerization/phosphoacceptor domain -containing protein [Chloroflexus sp.]
MGNMPQINPVEIARLQARLAELEELVRALQMGEADALVIDGPRGPLIYTLRGAEHPYRVLVETMNEGALTLLADGTILYCNGKFAEMVGLPQDQLTGRSLLDLIAPADRLLCAELLSAGAAGSSKGPITLQAIDGSQRPAQISLRALQDETEANMCAVVTDLSGPQAVAAQLRAALAEKELLLREVHHRVKNNLQIVSSLLRLQAENISDERVSAAVQDSQNRIRALALVHEQLYRSESLAHIDIGEYLQSIATSVWRSLSMRGSPIRLASEVSHGISINIDQAIALGLIVTELVSNSVKHAFPHGPKDGTISLRLHKDGNTLHVEVADNGIGMPAQVNAGGGSLGMQLVHGLCRQIGAALQFGDGPGTTVIIRVPMGKADAT